MRRYVQLFAGLLLLGCSVGAQVHSHLGAAPWDVLHQGLSLRTGLPLGDVVIAVSVVVLLAWIPLRQAPGAGTVANTVLLGVAVNWSLSVLPVPTGLSEKALLLAGGVAANAVGTALYVGAGLGPGPRDGLMTGLARRGHSVRRVRTSIEVGVLVLGWLLGGVAGPGTLIYAVGIGPAVHQLLPRLTLTTTSIKAGAVHLCAAWGCGGWRPGGWGWTPYGKAEEGGSSEEVD